MSLLLRQPHTVSLVRPKEKRDAGDNSGELDYGDPELTKDVKCQFQTRGGSIVIADEGTELPFDAVVLTRDSDIKQNDQINVSLSWATGKFIVVEIQPKARIQGAYSHNEVLLRKDNRR